MDLVYLDSETTGMSFSDKMVELAIVDDKGDVLINTLLNPGIPISCDASRIHCISDEMVKDAPLLQNMELEIIQVVQKRHVVIYNAKFDLQYLTTAIKRAIQKTTCCMQTFAPVYGEWDSFHGNYRWKSLSDAAEHIGYKWIGKKHRALSDSLACRAVWHWLEKQKPTSKN